MPHSISLPTPIAGTSDLRARLLRGAWLGVLLGLSIEALLLAIAFWHGQLPDAVRIAADTVQKLSWSSLVCAALAAGQAATRRDPALAGISGLVAAPLAFLGARALHKATLELLGAEVVTSATQWLAAGIKGVEYALLGVAMFWLSRRNARWKPYAISGAIVGAATFLLTSGLLPATGDPLQRAIVEILHPVGCALAVHASAQVHARLGRVGGGD